MNTETERLLIRDLEIEDLHAIHVSKSNAKANQYTAFYSASLDETRNWLKATIYHNEVQPRTSHNCAVVLKETNEVLGWIGFGDPSEEHRAWGDIDFGYGLAKRYWGNGYMTEAVAPITDYAFEVLGFDTLIFKNAVGNRRSRRVKEKTGARLLGTTNARYVDPGLSASELWELTPSAWQHAKNSLPPPKR